MTGVVSSAVTPRPLPGTDGEAGLRQAVPAWSRVTLLVLVAGAVGVPVLVARWRADPFVFPKLTALWVLLGVCTVTLAAAVRTDGAGLVRLRFTPVVDVALATYVVFTIAATTASVDPNQSIVGEPLQYQGLLTTLLYVSFFVVARLCVTSVRDLLQLLTAVAVGTTMVALYAIAQQIGFDPLWGARLRSDRSFASIGQPNALAAYLVMGPPVTVLVARRTRGLRLVLAVAALAAQVLAVLLTQSRGGYLALAVSMVLVVVVSATRPSVRLNRPLAASLCVLVVLGLASTPARTVVTDSWSRLLTIQDLTDDVSIREHVDIWRVGGHIAREHPVLGTGPETFPDVFPASSRAVLSTERADHFDRFRVESPHNLYLAIASGSGLFALAALAVFALGFGRTAIAEGRRDQRWAPVLATVVIATVGYAITNLFMTADLSSTWLIWVLMGAVVGVTTQPQTKALPEKRANPPLAH